MRTGLVAGVIAAGSVITLVGCSTGTGAPPEPVQPSSTQAASPIPPVKNPRDVAAMARRTCELLTPQQAKGFGLDLPPTPSEAIFGTVACTWIGRARERERVKQLDISVFTNNPTLEVAYSRGQGRPFFELTEIAGYPAVVTRTNADIPRCGIDVKAAERQSVTVIYDSKEFSKNPQQACEVAKQVAAAVLMNVPPKS